MREGKIVSTLFFLLLSVSYIQTIEWISNIWFYIGVISFSAFSFMLILQKSISLPRSLFVMYILLYLLVMFGSISALIGNDTLRLIEMLGFTIVSLIICLVVSNIEDNLIIGGLVKVTLVLIFSVTILSLMTDGFYTLRFRGIFYNPNSMGQYASTSASICFGALIAGFNLKRPVKALIFVSIPVLIVFLLASNSRGAILALGLSIITGVYFSKRGNIFKMNRKIVGGILLIGISILSGYYFGVIDPMLDKMIMRSESDISGGRMEIWQSALTEFSFFGHGQNYFVELGTSGAHNTFISHLGQYGFFIAILYSGLFIWGLYTVIVECYINKSKIGIFACCCLINFWVLALIEIMTVKPAAWIAIIVITLVASNRVK